MKFQLIILVIFVSCTATPNEQINPAYDLSNPPETPELFMQELIQGDFNTRDIAISKDGNEIFYTIVAPRNKISAIVMVKKVGSIWSEPEVASFSGKYSDIEPFISPDNQRLYFSSARPLETEGEPKDFDIWMVERKLDDWSIPVRLDDIINTEENEFFPSITNSGNLYFTAQYEDSKGREDIYVSEFQNGNYTTPYSLSDSINSSTWEFNAFVTPDENVLFFTSFGRSDDLGGGDLYASVKVNGYWTQAIHLDNVNTPGLDYCPFFDERYGSFYYTSDVSNIKAKYDTALTFVDLQKLINSPKNGNGNIYWVSAVSLNLR